MYKSITLLSSEQESELKSDFRKNLGERLKRKREKAGLTQKELGYCISEDDTSISKYEHGTRDINASQLPLIGVYCGFPVHELFPADESKDILESFSSAVSIIVDRERRQNEVQKRKADKQQLLIQKGKNKILKAQVYEIDGKEVVEPVQEKTDEKTLRAKYKSGEMNTEYGPYTGQQFCDFVRQYNEPIMDTVISAGKLLGQIKDLSQKDTLRGAIADYIVDELVINKVAKKQPDEQYKRAYAYYRQLINAERNRDFDSNGK